jgi:hypothetical protein
VHSTEDAPLEVLENISDPSGFEELVDFDDLEAHFDDEDDPGQAKA